MSTYTFLRPLPEEGSPLFEAPSLSLSAVPAWWLHSLPGRVVAATHIAVVSREPPHSTHIDIRQYSPHFNRSSFVTAASVDDGDFRVTTDWRARGPEMARDGPRWPEMARDMTPEARGRLHLGQVSRNLGGRR